MRKRNILLILVIAVVVVGGILAWYAVLITNSNPIDTQTTSNTSNALEGTLQSIDCTTAGAGCTDWALNLSNGGTQALVVSQDVKTYENKQVRITGRYVKTFGDSGPTFFEVESIQALE